MIAQVGTVSWDYFPQKNYEKVGFPPEIIAKEFPDYIPARWNEQQQIEIQGNSPVLIGDIRGFRTLKDYQEDKEKYEPSQDEREPLWVGTAKEMTKNLWFEQIFPHLHPFEQATIVQFLARKKVKIPTLPELPDNPYVYYIGNNQWEVHLSRLWEPIQYLDKEGIWTVRHSQADRFYSKKSAQEKLNHILVKA